jgi:hypothetical protein
MRWRSFSTAAMRTMGGGRERGRRRRESKIDGEREREGGGSRRFPHGPSQSSSTTFYEALSGIAGWAFWARCGARPRVMGTDRGGCGLLPSHRPSVEHGARWQRHRLTSCHHQDQVEPPPSRSTAQGAGRRGTTWLRGSCRIRRLAEKVAQSPCCSPKPSYCSELAEQQQQQRTHYQTTFQTQNSVCTGEFFYNIL